MLCKCGCGMETLIWEHTRASSGAIKGRHAKYLPGHSNRRPSVRKKLSRIRASARIRNACVGDRFGGRIIKRKLRRRRISSGFLIHFWEMLCDCGDIRPCRAQAVVDGKVPCCKSCALRTRPTVNPVVLVEGQCYGRLVFRGNVFREKGRHTGCFECYCGQVVRLTMRDVVLGQRVTCGCRKGGISKHPLYRIWGGIVQRCYNSKNPAYRCYGGVGIGMHPSWRMSAETFIKDVERECGSRPKGGGWQLHRLNSLGNYEPGNVKWLPKRDNALRENKRGAALEQENARLKQENARLWERVA